MSYDIDQGVEDQEEHLAFLKALKEACPDATRHGRRWTSPSLTLTDCDGFALATEKRASSDDVVVYAELYRTVGTGRVYPLYGRVHLDALFFRLKEKNPEFYGLFLHKLKDEV